MSGGGTTTKSKSTSVGSISPQLQGRFDDFSDLAFDIAGQLQDIGPYRGRFIAKPTAQQFEGLNWLEDLARSRQKTGFGDDVVNMAQSTARGDYLDPKTNPWMGRYLKMGMDPFVEAFTEKVIPRTRSNAIAVGADLSPREGLVEMNAARETGRQLRDFETDLLFDVYRGERQNMNLAPMLLQQAAQLQEDPARLLGEVGDTLKSFDQEKFSNKILQHQELQRAAMLPLAPAAEWAGLAPGFLTDVTTKGTQTSKKHMNWVDYLGAVLSIAGMGGMGGK